PGGGRRPSSWCPPDRTSAPGTRRSWPTSFRTGCRRLQAVYSFLAFTGLNNLVFCLPRQVASTPGCKDRSDDAPPRGGNAPHGKVEQRAVAPTRFIGSVSKEVLPSFAHGVRT